MSGNRRLTVVHVARSHKIRKLFLDQIALGWTESKAARAAGQPVRFFRDWAAEDENFKQDWEDAESTGTDRLEDKATSRALKQSDQLLVHQLRARRPHKHREKPPELSVSVKNDFSSIDAELERKIARATQSDQGGKEATAKQRTESQAEA
jgi:hypothetical protein